jgi:phenylpropionate dioxygenase-like ring-hydroxylating dioxygenase large terminal subunit
MLTWCPAGENNIEIGEEGKPIVKTTFRPLTGLTDDQRLNLCLFYVYPNFWVFPSPDVGLFVRMFPVGPGRLHMLLDYLLPPHVLEDPEYAEKFAAVEKYVEWFNSEDTAVCAAIQRNVESGYAERGHYAKAEGHNRAFTAWYARQMTA